ncbi:uncharacterized protein NPIL_341021 [Nephila pilipes]|uniref:Uncharacterized protein n=1 Tax=Nephila pilipes TaxID=299642 RepID=A0A8X6UJ80_NEPPI|nr:uncharacterized protein NPIL_341021 [Nephila pilipes]
MVHSRKKYMLDESGGRRDSKLGRPRPIYQFQKVRLKYSRKSLFQNTFRITALCGRDRIVVSTLRCGRNNPASVSAYSSEEKDAMRYLDEVLFLHLPSIVNTTGSRLHKMPDFSVSHNGIPTEDGIKGLVIAFFNGSVTGLHKAYRESCEFPLRSRPYDNIRLVCKIILPRIEINYAGSLVATFEYRDFQGGVVLKDVEAKIEVTPYPDDRYSTVTSLQLLNLGNSSVSFNYLNNAANDLYVPFHEMNHPFYNYCEIFFKRLFYGPYWKILDKVVTYKSFPK